MAAQNFRTNGTNTVIKNGGTANNVIMTRNANTASGGHGGTTYKSPTNNQSIENKAARTVMGMSMPSWFLPK